MYRGAACTAHDVLEHMLLDQSAEPMDLPLSLLQDITNNFADDQEIGAGGFAVVYKGLLQNGMVAVKKLDTMLDMDEKIFNQEVQCLMKTKHKNVVRFLGYCADTQGKTIQHEGKFVMADLRNRLLCFEYVPSGSLEQYITDASCGLGWRDRYRIIKGICEGLDYLHGKRILHLDLKPSNILVDGRMIPKITDFGLSRCFDENQSRTVTSKLIGSLGYLAPESYNYNRQITFKLDIYSLGVIIMEILTGEKGYHPIESVVESWMNRLETSGPDPRLEQVRVCTEIGIECMHFDPAKRPVTWHIIDMLDKTESGDCSAKTGMSTLSLAQKTQNSSNELQQGTPKLAGEPGFKKFTAKQLLFGAKTEFLGKGTYGTVYKVTLKDGNAVVVKILRNNTKNNVEFEAEARALGKIRHPNLLVLRGYSLEDTTWMEEKMLLFEFMRKGSLYALLHAHTPSTVDWAMRMAIAKGISRGLAYLNDDLSIVHGNLTSRRVLLDDQSTPKITDFGMSLLMTAAAFSDVDVRLGYRVPELSDLSKASSKTDVYSLGIILLELLTSKSPPYATNGMNLPQWVGSIVKEEWATKVFDQELMQDVAAGGSEGDELMDTLKLALQCVDASPSVRPDAREVLRQLEEIRPGPVGGTG